MKLRWGVLGVGAACLACCAPLILPWLAGVGLVSVGAAGAGALVFGLTLEQIVCYGVPALGLAALLTVWWRRSVRKRAECGCETACDVDSCGSTART